jgi:uncharacterized small protein (DUF1192 family)
MEDDDGPKPKPTLVTPRLLEPMGVEELRDYITALRAEIARAESEITRKQGHRGAADALFRRDG